MTRRAERAGGSLINIILGALILWVGQTTFQHAGILATVDQKFAAIEQRFVDVDKRHDSTRNWLEKVVAGIKEVNHSRFTNKDGEKLEKLIEIVDDHALELERQFAQRIQTLELKLVALEAKSSGFHNESELRWEIAQLRGALRHATGDDFQETVSLAERPMSLPPISRQQ